jgi:peptidyl-prolyl cis-trans isomerase C
MAKASARHILVDDEKFCSELIEKINSGTDFAELAKQHSKCPSGQQGGDLGEFGKGVMVPEFEAVVFNDEIGKAHGPVKTDFGYHVLEVTSRTDD